MSAQTGTYAARRVTLSDRYVVMLALALLGYAMLGKGFAYFGIPPLFVGEAMLVLGLVVLFQTGCSFAVLTTVPSLLLATLIAWVVFRTIPYVRVYGVDALRDSVIAVYGIFAFVTIALLLERPERIFDVMRYLGFFTWMYGALGFFVYYFSKMGKDYIPMWPISGVPIISLRGGEVSAHLAGAAVFMALGMGKVGKTWIVFLLIGIAMVAAQSRGGMLAILTPLTFALIVGGKGRTLGIGLSSLLAVLAVAYVLDLEFAMPPDQRVVGARQLVDNFTSIFGQSENAALDGTKIWRMRWWEAIQNYTLHGPYFWWGKGFGVNLAEADGFVVGLEFGGPVLRSPHNGNMTVLARSGVPGLALWAMTLLSVFVMLARHTFMARHYRDRDWSNLFLFLGCYIAAIIIDASFDVALEGPMLGIWFWVLIGLSIGSCMIYRAHRQGHARALSMPPVGGALGITLVAILALHPGRADAAEAPDASMQARRVVPKLAGQVVSNPDGSCLTFRGLVDAIIENVTIGPCRNHGILLVDSKRVLIRNVTVHDAGESGVYILNSQAIDVANSTITNAIAGIFAKDSTEIHIDCNTIEDVRGPIPSGQLVQFNNVNGPRNRITCNVGRNHPGRGRPEDAISTYHSSGTEESPITIADNLIVGGGPSESGGGIMLGDEGGSYIVARKNVLVDPGQYGIAVASGHNMSVIDNLIYGRQQAFTNVGISVWNQYPHACHSVTVRANRVSWISKTGRPNPWWDGGNCGPIDDITENDFSAAVTPSIADDHTPSCTCGAAGRR